MARLAETGGIRMKNKRRYWLITLRDSAGFTQKDFCKLIGIDRGNYCAIENGKQDPRPEVALKIARALNFNMEKFYIDTF